MPDGCQSEESLRSAIESRLSRDETLLWVGQPDPKQVSREVRRAWVFQSVLIALFAAVCPYLILNLSPVANTIFPAIVLGGSLIVYVAIVAPWRYPERVLQAIYAVTDRRAIVYHGFGWSSLWLEALPDLYNTLWSFGPREIRARRKIPRYDGRIDLVFSGENHDHMTGKGQIPDRVQVGFLGLANIEVVDQLLD